MNRERFSKIKIFLLIFCLICAVCAFSVGFFAGCGDNKNSGSNGSSSYGGDNYGGDDYGGDNYGGDDYDDYGDDEGDNQGQQGGNQGGSQGGNQGANQDGGHVGRIVSPEDFLPKFDIDDDEDDGEEKEPETAPPVIHLYKATDTTSEYAATGSIHLGTIDKSHFNGVLDLPVMVAEDDADGTLTENLYVVSASGSRFCTVKYDATRFNGRGGYTFQSTVGGRHEIIYFAMDSEGNETYRSVTVDVETGSEEKELGGSNDIDALANSGGVFTENFAKGPNSPLLKNNYKAHSKLAGDSASSINGNSLVVDFNGVSLAASSVHLFNLSPYLVSGIWEVEFDVKLVSGKAFEPFYFAYGKSDATYGARYTLKGMSVGEVRHVTYKQAIEIPEDEEGFWYFYLYNNYSEGYLDAVISLDNFVFKRVDHIADIYVPTVEELEEGVVFDWSDEHYASLGIPTNVADIEDATVRATLAADDNFGDRVMLLNNASPFTGLTSYKNELYFEANKVYDIKIHYYVKTLGEPNTPYTTENDHDSRQAYLIMFDASTDNRLLKTNVFAEQGVAATANIRFVTGTGEKGLTFYNKCDGMQWEIYIGNIEIIRADKTDLKVNANDYHTLTSADIAADGGYTFDMTRGNIPRFTNDNGYLSIEYYSTAKLPEKLGVSQTAIDEYFTPDDGNGNAILLSGTSVAMIGAEKNIIKQGKTYKVEITAYSKEPVAGGKYILHFTDSKGQKQIKDPDSAVTCAIIPLGDNMYKIVAVYDVKADYGTYFGFYTSTDMSLLISSVNISEVDTRATATVSKSDINNKTYTNDFSSTVLPIYTQMAYAEYVGSGSDTVLHAVTGEGGYILFKAFDGLMESGKIYTLSIEGTSISAGNIIGLTMNSSKEQVGGGITPSIENLAGGKVRITLTVSASQNFYSFCLYNQTGKGVFEINIDSVSLSCVNDTRTDQTVTKAMVESASGYTSNFNTYKFNMGSIANPSDVNAARVTANIAATPYTYTVTMSSTGSGTDKTELKLNSLSNVFEGGKNYLLTLRGTGTVTGKFYLFCYSDTGYTTQLALNFNKTFATESGAVDMSFEFTAPDGTKAIMIWASSGAVANLTVSSISLIAVADSDVRPTQTITQETVHSAAGYTSDFDHYKFNMGSLVNSGVNSAKVTANIDATPYTYSVQMANSGNATDLTELKLNSLSGVFLNGGHYILTVNGTGTATGTIYLFCYSDTGYTAQLTPNFSQAVSVTSGAIAITFEFDAPDGTKAIMLWAGPGATVDMTVTSISLKGTTDVTNRVLSDGGYTVKPTDEAYAVKTGRTNATHSIVTGTGVSGLGDTATKYEKVELGAAPKNQFAYSTFDETCYTDGYTYVFRVKLFSEASNLNVVLLAFNSANAQLFSSQFTIKSVGDGCYYYDATFTGSENINHLMIYCLGGTTNTAFIESITLKGFAITDELIASENGVTVNVSDFMPYSRNNGATLTQGITGVTTDGTYLHATLSGSDPALSLDAFNGRFEAGETYTFGFTAYEVGQGSSMLFLPMDASGTQLKDGQNSISYTINKIDLGGGFYKFEATFTAPEGLNSILVYFNAGNGEEMYVSSVSLKKA